MSQDLQSLLLSFQSGSEVREDFIKMPFGYPGNKFAELKQILQHIPIGKGYAEPFGGSGVVLLNRPMSKLEIFNDRYAGVTDFIRVARDPALLPQLLSRLEYTLHSREEFIWCKTTWKDTHDPVERAARWYYTIRFAVNSKPNSTFGRAKGFGASFASTLHNSLPLFHAVHSRFKNVTLENLDWRTCIHDFDQVGMVWYFDPTYLDNVMGNYEFEMKESDHREMIHRIADMKGFVAVSSYSGPKTNAIYDVAGLWTDKIEWERPTKALTQAFLDTNHLDKKETSNARHIVKECLWIRDFR